MIFIGKAPYRVSLLGGSSDLDWFVKENNYGVCLGYSLDQYSYSVLNILPESASKGLLEYSAREKYSNINEIVHPIVREALLDFNISKFIELKTFGFASGGSGLGGSASFILSLISSLTKAFDIDINEKEIIEKACYLEIHKLKKSVGKQDQYLCAHPGFNSFSFYSNDNVKNNQISPLKLKILNRLSNDFYLIPTYRKRNSEVVLAQIKTDKDSVDKIIKIREIASDFLLFDDEREYKVEELFHESIRESWNIKKSLSKVMTLNISEQYQYIDRMIPNNWIRLIGAGGGGYFLISSKIKEDQIIKLSKENGIKGIFKASVSNEGLNTFKI